MYRLSAHLYDAIYAAKDYEAEASTVGALIGQYGQCEGRALLDVACGTARHLEHLARSFEAEGLDIEPALLAAAHERCPGVRFHLGDMTDFTLGRQYDAVVCLFSAIGYAGTPKRLAAALCAMAAHTVPGGVVIVEAWLRPDVFVDGHLSALFVDRPDLKVARMAVSRVVERVARFDMHYMVASGDRIETFVERHELGLFTDEEYRSAFAGAGLELVEVDPAGFIGRTLYVGRLPQPGS